MRQGLDRLLRLFRLDLVEHQQLAGSVCCTVQKFQETPCAEQRFVVEGWKAYSEGIIQAAVPQIRTQPEKHKPIDESTKGCDMTQKTWKDELVEKYPKMLQQVAGQIDVGDGWRDLLDSMCDNIERQEAVNKALGKDRVLVEFVQIKEKFGGLRAYFVGGYDDDGGYDKAIKSIVDDAENKSFHVCEECGTTESVATKGSWIVSLCVPCRDKRTVKKDLAHT